MRHLLLSLIIIFFISNCHNSNPSSFSKDKINIEEITIKDIHQSYLNDTFTVRELVQTYLNRIDSLDQNGPQLNSIIQLNPKALEIADSLDIQLKKGITTSLPPLFGVPVVIKDNIDIISLPTTAGSRILRNSYPLQDSWVTKKLKENGAIILAKTNLSELANFHSSYSSSGWSGLGGQTKNPYDTTRNPCGSSSGSGVAVAANLATLAIGTETNGSIVCPSNNNGIVGIKPTVGLISRTGIIPISFTQDTAGPMARTVTDATICLGTLTGIDSTDSKTLKSKNYHNYTQFLKKEGLKGKRIGLYTLPMGHNYRLDNVMQQAIDHIKKQGAQIIEIDQISEIDVESPSFEVMLYEFKDGLNHYLKNLGPNAPIQNLEELISQTFQDSIEMQYFDHTLLKMAQEKGNLNSKEYQNALSTLLEHSREKGLDKVMNEHQLDALIAPTGSPAWKTDLINGDNFGVFSSSPAAIAGYPSITVPMGFIDGLPVGISFFGRAWSEPLLIEMAYSYEQSTLHRKKPIDLYKEN